MVIVLVEHFLTDEGKRLLPAWIDSVREALGDYPGFVGIEQIKDEADANRTLLFLQFDTLENLRHWTRSEAHESLLAELEPRMVQKQKSQIFSTIR